MNNLDTMFFIVITRSSIATVKELLTNGANVNVEKTASNKETGMLTPLMCAVLFTHSDQDPHAETIQLLIQNGAKTEECNPYGYKAAEMALAKGCKVIHHIFSSVYIG